MGPETPGATRQSPSAPSIASHHKNRTGKQDIGSPQDPVNGGLARAVAIIEKMVRVGIVDRDNRIPQKALTLQAPQPDNTCRCFFGASNDAVYEMPHFSVE